MYTHHTTHAPLGSLRRQGPPFSSLRERPLSVASTLSAVSVVSTASTSSAVTNTGERRRRSAALLELDVDDATRSSLLRAEQVLRASEQERQWDARRSSWRERQARSRHFLEDLPSSGEVEELEGTTDAEAPAATATLKRFSPKRLLRKSRSSPSDIVLGPKQDARPTSPIISGPMRKSPSPRKPLAPRRSASAADMLSTDPSVNRRSESLARPISPPQHDRFGTLPLRLSHLPLPQHEPQSKFSASSGDSMVHVVSFGVEGDKPRRGFKDRARTFSQASAGGLKSLKGRVGKTRSIRGKQQQQQQRSSLANLFAGLGGSSDESGADQAKQRAISSSGSRPPPPSSETSRHRPSTSISSYAPSSAAATSDSGRPSRKPSRLGFFRSTLKRDSTTSKRNSVRTRSSGQVSPSLISRPVSLAASETLSPGVDKRFSEAMTSSQDSGDGPGESSKGKGGWASRLSKAVKGKNVAAKKALFEGHEVVQQAQKVTARESTLSGSSAFPQPLITCLRSQRLPT